MHKGRWSNSMLLLKESWRVVMRHKQLMIFPILSAVASIILVAALSVPTAILTGITKSKVDNDWWFFVFFAIFYFICSFIVIFFNTGLISCAKTSLDGGEPTFREGMRAAMDNLGKITGWAAFSATVGLALALISSRAGAIGQIVTRFLAAAWSLITFFVIPLIIFDGQGVWESVKSSGSLFKKTWGENLIARFSIGLIFGLLGLIGVLAIVGSAFTKTAAVILPVVVIVIAYWVVLLVFAGAFNGVLAVALYEYATTYRPGAPGLHLRGHRGCVRAEEGEKG